VYLPTLPPNACGLPTCILVNSTTVPAGDIFANSRGPATIPIMVRTFLKVYMELGSYFLFLQEQIKDIIIMRPTASSTCGGHWGPTNQEIVTRQNG